MRGFTIYMLIWLTAWISAAGDSQRQSVPGPNEEWASALRAVVESEHAFARSAAEKGTRDAFLAFIAEDGVLFRPQPVPGKKFLTARPATPGKLSWRPVFADVSASGDLGYTTGPYEFRKAAEDVVPASFGNYFTIWKKQPGGAWRFIVDFGTSNPKPGKILPDFDPGQAKPAPAPKTNETAESAAASLMKLEHELSSVSAIRGASALQAYIAPHARFLRQGRQPAVGLNDVNAVLEAGPGEWTWEPVQAGASRAGDLGFTYGTCELHALSKAGNTQLGYYLRVFQRQPNGAWKIAAEVVNF